MNNKWKWSAQLGVVLLCALGLKAFYSTASPDALRFILAPTTWLVELVSGRSFDFEAHAGYMSSDHSFLIAAPCAGVNFLITAFVMLTLRELWLNRYANIHWSFIPIAAVTSLGTTIITNAVRICVALRLQGLRDDIMGLNPSEIHRTEGILVYFGFLLLLYMITETGHTRTAWDWLKRARLPLGIYYVVTLGLPFLNGAFRQGMEFWEHSAFVLILPLVIVAATVIIRWLTQRRQVIVQTVSTDGGISDC
jgi:exosortase K